MKNLEGWLEINVSFLKFYRPCCRRLRAEGKGFSVERGSGKGTPSSTLLSLSFFTSTKELQKLWLVRLIPCMSIAALIPWSDWLKSISRYMSCLRGRRSKGKGSVSRKIQVEKVGIIRAGRRLFLLFWISFLAPELRLKVRCRRTTKKWHTYTSYIYTVEKKKLENIGLWKANRGRGRLLWHGITFLD